MIQKFKNKNKAFHPMVYCLAVLGIFEPLITQIYYLLPIRPIGPLSLLQVYRGGVLAFLIFILLKQPLEEFKKHRLVVALCIVFHICFIVWTLAHSSFGREFSIENVVVFSRISYWLCFWLCVCIFINDKNSCRLLLTALVIGASINCLFIYWGYITGSGIASVYETQVKASFGVEGSSGKGQVGYMATAGFLAVYLWRNRFPWLSTLLACFLIGGTILTYDRSIQVALGLAIAWLAIWRLFTTPNRKDAKFCERLIILGVFGLITFFSTVGLEGLSNRWADITTESAGAGRRLFYLESIHYFSSADADELLLGAGRQKMLYWMWRQTGARAHTHSDLFDMLFFGGIPGILVYGFLWLVIFSYLKNVSRLTVEFAIMGCVIAVYMVTSLITGQLGAITAMATYTGSVTCLNRLSKT